MSQVSEKTTVKNSTSFPSQEADYSDEQFEYKEELFQNSLKVPDGNDFCLLQEELNNKPLSAGEEGSQTEGKTQPS